MGGVGAQGQDVGGVPQPEIQPEYVRSFPCEHCYVTSGCLACTGMHSGWWEPSDTQSPRRDELKKDDTPAVTHTHAEVCVCVL